MLFISGAGTASSLLQLTEAILEDTPLLDQQLHNYDTQALAKKLTDDIYFKNHKIALIEKDEKNKNDRTISFWEEGKGEWDSIICGSWKNANFISDEYQQMQGSVVLNSLLPNDFKTSIFMTKGEPVQDNISLNYSLGLSINRLIKNKPLKVSLKQSFYDGGRLE